MERKLSILIVDDDRRMARTVGDILKVKGYQAETAFSGSEALKKIKETHFDCVLTDVKMPGINGVELYQAIKEIRPYLPVVLMTAYSSDALIKKGLKEGALASLTKPLDINLLLSFFSSLRREQSIVIVDDDLNFSKTLAGILKERDFQVTQVSDPKNLTDKLKPEGEIVLLDMKLNEVSGLEVLKEIRKLYPCLPVILVTGYREEMSQAIKTALEISAYACLCKPFQIDELIQLLGQIQHWQWAKVLDPTAQLKKAR